MSEGAIASVADDVESDEWQRVNPLSMIVQSLGLMVSALGPLGATTYFISRDSSDNFQIAGLFAGGAFLLALAISGLFIWLAWSRLRYCIGVQDVRLEHGILSRTARTVPYDRIQDVSLEQKLLPRLLGLVEVTFETGAGGSDELRLAYVRKEEGERLREVVRELVDGASQQTSAPASGMADSADSAGSPEGAGTTVRSPVAADGRVLFTMAPRRLLTFGLFSFSLVLFAAILGIAQQFEAFLPWDTSEMIDRFFEGEHVRQAEDTLNGLSLAAKMLAALYAFATVIVIGMLSGIAKTFVRDWEFTLERTAKGFRRRRGLFTKTDVVMPVHRVQALVLSTGIIRRRFGWHGLSFISLAQDFGNANHDVAPFAKMDEITPIAAEAGFALPDGSEDWGRPSPRYYLARGVLQSLFVLVLGIAGLVFAAIAADGFVPGLVLLALVIVALLSLIALRQFYHWRYDRYALDPAQIVSRRGWLAPHTHVASRVKLHSVEIAQGPLGRWQGYCHLVFGMAGGTFVFRGLRMADARKLRAAVLDSIASVDFARLPR